MMSERTTPAIPTTIRTTPATGKLTPLIVAVTANFKIVPTAIEFVDIAGLVKGASAGEGLGNQFLSHIREVDAIVQVVRCFENSNIHHVSGSIDPVRDIEVINTELVLADLAALQKRRDRLQKEVRAGSKAAKAESAIIEKLLPHLDSGKPAVTFDLSPEEKVIARDLFLLTSKSTLFACNVAESDLAAIATNDQTNAAAKHVAAVQDYARNHFATEAVVVSAQAVPPPAPTHAIAKTASAVRRSPEPPRGRGAAGGPLGGPHCGSDDQWW